MGVRISESREGELALSDEVLTLGELLAVYIAGRGERICQKRERWVVDLITLCPSTNKKGAIRVASPYVKDDASFRVPTFGQASGTYSDQIHDVRHMSRRGSTAYKNESSGVART